MSREREREREREIIYREIQRSVGGAERVRVKAYDYEQRLLRQYFYVCTSKAR
jgi:hypothetical protein